MRALERMVRLVESLLACLGLETEAARRKQEGANRIRPATCAPTRLITRAASRPKP